jgi:hypothetical protein
LIDTDNSLEKDPECRVEDFDLKRQVSGILEKNFKRNRLIRNALLDWTEHCDMVALTSSVAMDTQCEEYDQLLELGSSIIPHLMLQYKKKDGPVFRYELLHELLWGYRTGQMTVSLEMQYDIWADWFEKQNFDQAPHYRRPQEDSV